MKVNTLVYALRGVEVTPVKDCILYNFFCTFKEEVLRFYWNLTEEVVQIKIYYDCEFPLMILFSRCCDFYSWMKSIKKS